MAHILEVLPPPDLSYPPEELDMDRPILTWETSYMRTRLPEDDDDAPVEPQDLSELASFRVVVNQFVPEKNGCRMCAMCGYV